MSRSKRAAQKRRKAAAQQMDAHVAAVAVETEPRLGPPRRRGKLAKTAVGVAAAASFGIWMALARASYAGHAKHHIRPLSIPQPLYQVVRRNLLQAGIIAPATAPPDATTSTS